MEVFIDIAAILCNIGFVVGSYCFASPSNTVYAFGDWLFISGSVFHVAHSLHDLVEQVRALKLKHPVKDHSRDEVMETTNFLISGSCFLVGCVFFLPGFKTILLAIIWLQALVRGSVSLEVWAWSSQPSTVQLALQTTSANLASILTGSRCAES